MKFHLSNIAQSKYVQDLKTKLERYAQVMAEQGRKLPEKIPVETKTYDKVIADAKKTEEYKKLKTKEVPVVYFEGSLLVRG
jgi:hypothetical protein